MRNWRYWGKLDYWHWWWEEHPDLPKVFLFLLVMAVVGLGGFVAADAFTASAEVSTEKLVTVIRKTPGGMTTEVVTQTGTVTKAGKASVRLRTVMRDGRTVVIASPAETVTDMTTDLRVMTNTRTVPGPEREKEVTATETNTRTQTDTQTETQMRTQTETQTQTRTETEVREVPSPTVTETTTKTQTETETQTETQRETVTRTETETKTVTETETETETVTETVPRKPRIAT